MIDFSVLILRYTARININNIFVMGNQPLKVVNCSGKTIYYKIDCNRTMLSAVETEVTLSLAEVASVSSRQRMEFENKFA